ncbi:MAG: hypothetical protein L6V88_06585 [Anaerotruncus sp.]|nr:MAG: hypothetical protein L6V88_06585 [Anaerotruncus sp.]
MHPWCRCHYGVAVADWDKWQDEYVKKHGGKRSTDDIIGSFRGAGGSSKPDKDAERPVPETSLGVAKKQKPRKKAFINAFIKKYENAKFENMLVIEKNGNVHHFTSNLPDQIFLRRFLKVL